MLFDDVNVVNGFDICKLKIQKNKNNLFSIIIWYIKYMLYICLIKNENDMKTSTIKNYNGQKTLIVNDLKSANVLELYREAVRLSIPFAVKQEIGIQIWGHSVVANYLGIKDSSKLLS